MGPSYVANTPHTLHCKIQKYTNTNHTNTLLHKYTKHPPNGAKLCRKYAPRTLYRCNDKYAKLKYTNTQNTLLMGPSYVANTPCTLYIGRKGIYCTVCAPVHGCATVPPTCIDLRYNSMHYSLTIRSHSVRCR